MKNILFILSLVIWCGCSNEIPFDTNRAEDMTVTRIRIAYIILKGILVNCNRL